MHGTELVVYLVPKSGLGGPRNFGWTHEMPYSGEELRGG